MPQLFRPSMNSWTKLTLVTVAILPWVVIFAGSTVTRSQPVTQVGKPLAQPVPFSHKHHVAELGIDCRYCHTSVETGKFAGIPATDTCMSCHSQIWTNSPLLEPVRKSFETGSPIKWANGDIGWNRVNKVPEFVYFDHSIHIERGVSCNICHGAVQKMQLTEKGQPFQMRWCLECHQAPEKFLRTDDGAAGLSPKEQIFDLYRKIATGTPLNTTEKLLAEGKPPTDTADQLVKGKQLVASRKIQVKQLQDCWICHR